MQDSTTVLPLVPDGAGAVRSFARENLLAPAQAIAAYFAGSSITRPTHEHVSLEAAPGRILAEEIIARENHPAQARSTMDGYAVHGAGAYTAFRIVGTVFAGLSAPRALAPGEAVRIATGGALPAGADAVVPQEDVQRDGDGILLHERCAAGDFITAAGADIRAGEAVLSAGRRIGAPELGVLATLGYVGVPVYRRPRIGIVSTGDELVAPASVPGPGQVRDSNRYALAAALLAYGAEPVHLAHAADRLPALRSVVRDGLAACDALVLSGGSSVGERDLVPQVVAEVGPPGILVHGLRVKPGKPTLLAAAGGKPIVGLPGNPTSALMMLEAVARPIVLALTGERAGPPLTLDALARREFMGRADWTWFIPVRLAAQRGALFAEPLALQSAHTSLLARAVGYVVVGETQLRIAPGERVSVHRFSSGGSPVEAA